MRTIYEFMKLEHTYLHKKWEIFIVASNTDATITKETLHSFTQSLLSHIKFEDSKISPIFNKYLGIEKNIGVTTVINHDHETLLRLLQKVTEAIDSNDKEKIKYTKNHFTRALLKHHKKEEEMIYGIFDVIIPKTEWEEILRSKS